MGFIQQENVRIGGGLMLLGVAFWLLSFADAVASAALVLAVVTLLVGWFQQSSRWLMPSGILFGLAAGQWFMNPDFFGMVFEQRYEVRGSLFSFCVAGGWLLVIIFTRLFTKTPTGKDSNGREHKEPNSNGIVYWAWVPSGLMLLLGFLSMGNGEGARHTAVLQGLLLIVAENWFLSLVALGAYIVFQTRDTQRR